MKITDIEIQQALSKFEEFKQAKEELTEKILENNKWWKLRQWEATKRVKGRENDAEPTSAWMFNSIANTHADIMDNFPAPNFLAREESDRETAEKLQKIVPCILEQCNFEQTYNDTNWYKLIAGTGVYGVFWDSSLEQGLGNINIKKMDALNVFWEAGISDIQDSSDVFVTALMDKEVLYEQYPDLKGKLTGGLTSNYITYSDKQVNDSMANQDKVVVYDWYYKKQVGTAVQLHYCKFVEGHVLYASEDDPQYADGFYDHGEYPFVFDCMYPLEGELFGFGKVDIMKSAQMYIDKLDQLIIKNCTQVGTPRYFVNENSGVNMKDFSDWQKPFVRVTGMIDESKLKQIKSETIPAYLYNHRLSKIDELKETSGNRDFSQGSTAAGVTAASAIAALQEAGSKLSRDMIKSSYRAHKKIVELTVELIRQFYTEDRSFRITAPNGDEEYMTFSNSELQPQRTPYGLTEEDIIRKPIFDIKIRSQKQSPFSREAQNETAKELYRMQFFNPQNAVQSLATLEMMDFEGIDEIKKIIRDNDIVRQASEQLIQLAMAMAQTVDNLNAQQGNVVQPMLPQVAQIAQQMGQQVAVPMGDQSTAPDDDVTTRVTKARMKARQGAEVK